MTDKAEKRRFISGCGDLQMTFLFQQHINSGKGKRQHQGKKLFKVFKLFLETALT